GVVGDAGGGAEAPGPGPVDAAGEPGTADRDGPGDGVGVLGPQAARNAATPPNAAPRRSARRERDGAARGLRARVTAWWRRRGTGSPPAPRTRRGAAPARTRTDPRTRGRRPRARPGRRPGSGHRPGSTAPRAPRSRATP